MWKQWLLAAGAVALFSTVCLGQRQETRLDRGWQFHKGPVAGAEALSFADTGSGWETVAVPHTWNGKDGEDGGNDYYRGESWYRRHVQVGPEMRGKSLYLRFEGVNRKADVYVNGTLVGSHAGGESAFCLDATKALREGDNVLAVKVSNRVDQDMPPLQADFTFFGGIYRGVELLALDPLHISASDYASPGVYISTPNVSAEGARVLVRTLVQNGGNALANASVRAQIFDGPQEIARVGGGSQPIDAGKPAE